MPTARANGIDIAYETFGHTESTPIVLIMGLGSQMVSWPSVFCRKLATAGHFVIRFDNRDVGRSTRMDTAGIPDIGRMIAEKKAGKPLHPPYTLYDMAMDTAGLMDAMNIPKAHICGISMGGFIAQILAIECPERMLSLISMASSTGAADLPPAQPGVMEAMLTPVPTERSAYIRHMADTHRRFAGGSEKFDASVIEEISARAFDRGSYPAGTARHYAAIVSAESRQRALAGVTIPILVVHGDADTLLTLEHGQATADAVPGAVFSVICGLGHGMAYPLLWDGIVAAIAAHTGAGRRAG